MTRGIYIAPYLGGPEQGPGMSPKIGSANHWNRFARALIDLAPDRLIEKSGILFAIEVVLIGMSVATGLVWLFATRQHGLSGMLWLDASLAVVLVGGALTITRLAKRPTAVLLDSSTAFHRRAYRVTDRLNLDLSGSRHSAKPAEQIDIPDHLDLEVVRPDELCAGDVVLVEAGQTIFAEGTVVAGAAIVDESAVTGQSARVVRWAYGQPTVMGDTCVVEGKILVQVIPRRGYPLDWLNEVTTGVRRREAVAAR